MSVLVTGAMGHVGYMTALACAEAGLEVVGHYHASYDPDLARAAAPRVTWVKGDVTDFPHLLELADRHRIEGVIHSAALPNNDLCRPVPVYAGRVNVWSTQALLELARLKGLRRLAPGAAHAMRGAARMRHPVSTSRRAWAVPPAVGGPCRPSPRRVGGDGGAGGLG